MNVLVFELDGERYGLLASGVREVARAVEPVALPGAPAVIQGIIDFHGEIVPLFDLRSRFHLASRPMAPTDHLICADAGGRLAVFACDRVIGLVQVEAKEIDDTRHLRSGDLTHVAGIAKLPDGVVLIHELATFLSEGESSVLDAALEAAESP